MVLPPERTFTCGILLVDRAGLPDDVRFDEDLPFSWGTDGEFYLRLAFMGHLCVHEPRAVAYHHAKVRQLEKAEGHISTRWRLILTYYRWRTLAVLAPALALYELGALAFFVAKRRPGVYFRYMSRSVRSLPATLRRRRAGTGR